MSAAPATDAPPAAGPVRPRFPIAIKVAAAIVAVVALVLAAGGAVTTWLAYAEAKRAVLAVQSEKAAAAARQIEGFVAELVGEIGWTTGPEWRHVSPEQQRYDFIRLLRQSPAITELFYVDHEGREALKVSRIEPDQIASGVDRSADPRFVGAREAGLWFGPVTFRRGSEPYVAIAMSHPGRSGGVTIAEVNLKFIADVIAAIDVGADGFAYVVGPSGRLVGHPEMSLVLRDTDMSALPQVAEVLAAPAAGLRRASVGEDLAGRRVLTSSQTMARLGWTVFVQSPIATAYAPVYAVLLQAALLFVAGLVLAALVGILLARRLTVPIRSLEAGAERLGTGDLSERMAIRTGDEIEVLAERFNTMAGRIKEAQDTLEAKVAERTRDLDEALTFQKESADVLEVINRSAGKVGPVLDAIIATASTLCRADAAAIRFVEDGGLRLAASSVRDDGPPQHETIPIDASSVAGRAVLLRRTVHVADLAADPSYSFVRRLGDREVRTGFGVPLVSEDEVAGVIVLLRFTPDPFTARQVDIVESLAEQAVIAIANARLVRALRTRTRELSRSLEELRAAQDRLVQTEKLASLGQLTAGIAHEIKNPLNFVNNFATLSAELADELSDQAHSGAATPAEVEELVGMLKGNLEKIANHGRRADSIVRNMLMHSRTGSGERRAVDVNALVDESLNLAYHGARATAPGFTVEMKRSLDPAAGLVDAYPQEIARALLNLAANAFHAMARRKETAGPDFAPVLEVATRDLGEAVEIVIRDNGTGIPKAVQERMFDPFFTTKPVGEGTGLGLSLTHDVVVKQHGGGIEIETEEGAFAEFRLRLPRGAPQVGGGPG